MAEVVKRLPFFEKAGYALGDTASNFFWKTFEGFLLLFYTDVFGISAAQAGTMFLVTRLWDAVNDPLMGILADRTKTRWGRFRPYLLWLALPVAAGGVLCFTTPDLSEQGKVWYAFGTYTLMMMLYTAINIPYSALMGVMTSDVKERASLSSFRFVGAFTCGMFVQKFTLDFVELLGGGNEARGWQLTMGLYGLVAAVMFVAAFASTKERVQPPAAVKSDVRQELKDLMHNGPWMVMFVLGLLVIASFWIRGGTTVYYFKYCVQDQGLVGWFLSLGTLAAIVGIALTGPLTRRFDKRKLYMGLMAVSGVLTGLFYFLEPSDIVSIFALNLLINFILGPNAPLVWAMYADTADYSEWKTGRRATGLVFSAATFAQKAGGAVGGWLTGMLLAYFGYQANVAQSAESQTGILLLMSVVPGVLCIVAAVAVYFYKLDDTSMKAIERELDARRRDAESLAATAD
jgi:GPH family glycoside/pentoside/hexuronide:cation symporter